MKRLLLSLLILIALSVSACGDDSDNKGKDDKKETKLPQAVSILDGGLEFRLPDGWKYAPVEGMSGGTVFYNDPRLSELDPEELQISISVTFGQTVELDTSDLPVKENLVMGIAGVTPYDEEMSSKSPKEIVETVFSQAGYSLGSKDITTFNNGAYAYYRPTDSDMQGIVGVIKEGDTIGVTLIATDKLSENEGTLAEIVRSIRVNPSKVPTSTPYAEPTQFIPTQAPVETVIVIVTATPDFVVTPFETPILPCTHSVQPGDTLASIALFYNISMADLMAANDITEDTTVLELGQELTLPIPNCEN
ncbi:MAG TPA: LysM peptidoglycan-binding domain-containing protein [Aggregatilineaceae bacterium]|nr:LysM peptidoglycan-binding domain-containing protein [Aggregatilineaceae bacterium]